MRAILALIVFGFVALSSFSEETPLLRGTVSDEMGAAIPGARVFLRAMEKGDEIKLSSKELSLYTDEYGRFSAQLNPIYYDVFVSVVGFSPQCRKVRLQNNKTLSVDFVMKLDPQVSSEFGHRVEAAPKKN